MIKLEHIALELLEYKIADIEAERPIKGGTSSAWDLYHFLEQEFAMLSHDEQLRLEAVVTKLKRHAVGPSQPRTALDTFDALVLDSFSDMKITGQTGSQDTKNHAVDSQSSSAINSELDFDFSFGFANTPANDTPLLLTDDPVFEEEQLRLQALASKVWWHDIEEIIQQLAIRCRVEKDRSMARLLYALTRNVERYLGDSSLDLANLQPKVLVPVTDYDDPLVSFNNIESLTLLVREVIEIIMNLGVKGSLYEDISLARHLSLDFVKRMAQAICQDPFAGKYSALPSKGPSSEQIRIAIQELAKEPMRDEQRKKQQNELESRLQATLQQEKRLENLFQQDVERFWQSAQVFFDRLEPYLPKRVGGQADDPALPGGVLFSQNPVLCLTSVPKEATSITVNLSSPLRLVLAGYELALSQVNHSVLLLINSKEYSLEETTKVNLGKQTLYAFAEGSYVHLNVEDETRSLAARIAETMAVFFVLSSDYKDKLLTILKTAATLSIGDSQTIIENAIGRLRELSATAPSRRKALEGLLQGAAKGNGISLPEHIMMSLTQRLITAMSVSADDLTVVLEGTNHSEAFIHQLLDDPLSLTLGGQATTIRKYRPRSSDLESIIVMMPGRIVGSFVNSLLQPFPGGTLMCVRSSDQIAVLYFENIHLHGQVNQPYR